MTDFVLQPSTAIQNNCSANYFGATQPPRPPPPAVVPKDEYDKINAELAKLKEREQKRSSAQSKYRQKQRETPRELTDEERLKKADYMREYAKKRREKQLRDVADKQLKLDELRKIAHTMTHEQLISNVFSFV